MSRSGLCISSRFSICIIIFACITLCVLLKWCIITIIIMIITTGDVLASECHPKPMRVDFTKNILHHLSLAENSTVIPYTGLNLTLSLAY